MNNITNIDNKKYSLDMDEIYVQIKGVLTQARSHAYNAVNFAMVQAYWKIGQIIVKYEQNGEIRAAYAKGILIELSRKMTDEFGTGFSVRNLQQIRKFYLTFPNANALRSELTWTHYRSLIRIKDDKIRNWYMNETIKSCWSYRQLDRQISTFYYERILASQEQEKIEYDKFDSSEEIGKYDFIKDPYVLEFLDLKNYPLLRETDLENALINKLHEFLLELGRGFCFVARQKLLRYENRDFYLDLVFYHSILKCYVLIDLKIGELTHQDIGQMDSYIRLFDDLYKNEDDNPTLGLILCSQKNEAIAKYSVLADGKQIFASKYKINLPTIEELQNEIKHARNELEKSI